MNLIQAQPQLGKPKMQREPDLTFLHKSLQTANHIQRILNTQLPPSAGHSPIPESAATHVILVADAAGRPSTS
jgi:hypothetical protein